MHWLDEPPVVSLDVVEEGDGCVVQAGPSSSTRREGAVNAVGGVVMGLFGARFLRTPLPLLFPVAFVVAGAVAVGVGVARLTGRCRVDVPWRDGVTFHWRLPPGPERRLHIPLVDVACLGIETRAWTTEHDHGGSDVHEDFVLALHTIDGRAIPFSCFATRAEAAARRAQLERVVLR
jgi:hypothetical protein